MAHRGRINVLTHILGKPYATMFGEFDGKHAAASAESETGDVKYHLGARTERTPRRWANGRRAARAQPEPSRGRESRWSPGVARARQRVSLGERLTGEFDATTVPPVLVHGDAAFPGEGIVRRVAEPVPAPRLHALVDRFTSSSTIRSGSRRTLPTHAPRTTRAIWRRASRSRSST